MPTLADYPDLAAQLDRKNGPIAPECVAYSTVRRLWWRCPAGPDHVWAARVADRTLRGRGCPFCAGKAVSVTNALSKVAPALARQWHPTKNGALRPRDVVAGSGRAAWWRCPKGPDHEWSAKIVHRLRGNGCPFCAGRRASATVNLAVAAPQLVPEWHPTKNGALRPQDVLPRSGRRFWWRCARGHAWAARAAHRVDGHGCPFCAGVRVTRETSLAALDPALAKQWHPTKNGKLTPRDVTSVSSRSVWWKCRKGRDHEWEAPVAHRRGGRGCPFCAGKRISVTNSLAAVRPDIAAEWHPTKNGTLTPRDLTPGSSRRVWWKCPGGLDHVWRGSVANRNTGYGCPYCANRRISMTNSLAVLEPKIAREWHPTKNGKLTPRDVTRGAHHRVWWRCRLGHEWQVAVNSRTGRGTGCPHCHRVRREQHVATTGRRRRQVRFAAYEGVRRGAVRRVK